MAAATAKVRRCCCCLKRRLPAPRQAAQRLAGWAARSAQTVRCQKTHWCRTADAAVQPKGQRTMWQGTPAHSRDAQPTHVRSCWITRRAHAKRKKTAERHGIRKLGRVHSMVHSVGKKSDATCLRYHGATEIWQRRITEARQRQQVVQCPIARSPAAVERIHECKHLQCGNMRL